MMKKSFFVAIALTAALLLGQNVYAVSVTGNVVPVATIPSAVNGIDGNLDVYEIWLNSETDMKVTAIDLLFAGMLAQVQIDLGSGANGTPLEGDVNFGPDAVAQDSHFVAPLTLPGDPIPPPSEGILTGIAQFQPTSGFAADLMSDQAAISGSAQAPSVLIAQIVLAPGASTMMSGIIAIEGNPDPVDVGQVPIGIPEPSTLLLAGMSLIGLIALRRRNG